MCVVIESLHLFDDRLVIVVLFSRTLSVSEASLLRGLSRCPVSHSGKWYASVLLGCFHLLSDCIFTVVLLFFRSWIFVVPVF